jgi:hypothetical protein
MTSLPNTLDEIMAMGRGALRAILDVYIPAFGLSSWRITASWVDPEASDDGNVVAGFCDVNPRYTQASIGIAWPPVGDIEETIVHELAHCYTARLAYMAGARENELVLDEWEDVVEQTARGAVALRRQGMRPPAVFARFCRSKFAALRRNKMDPTKLAELAMKAGEMAARDDVPEDARQLFTEFVAALAGGGGGGEAEPPPPAAEEDPNAPPPVNAEEDPSKMPAFARAILDRLTALEGRQQAPATPSPELAESRSNLVQSFLLTKPGLLSGEMERQLIRRGDLVFARSIVSEVERKPVQRSGLRAPEVKPAKPALTPEQQRMARRHKITDEQYASSLQRQNDRKAALGRGGN